MPVERSDTRRFLPSIIFTVTLVRFSIGSGNTKRGVSQSTRRNTQITTEDHASSMQGLA